MLNQRGNLQTHQGFRGPPLNPLVRSNADLPPDMCRFCLQRGHMGNECKTYREMVAHGLMPAFVPKSAGWTHEDGDLEPPTDFAEPPDEREKGLGPGR